jgi:hypothetical protein
MTIVHMYIHITLTVVKWVEYFPTWRTKIYPKSFQPKLSFVNQSLVEVVPAQVGAEVVNEAVDLAQPEHAQRLQREHKF